MHCLHNVTPSETVNPMFYLSVPPMSLNVFFVSACLICSLVFTVSIVLSLLVVMHFFRARLLCKFLINISVVNSMKHEYEHRMTSERVISVAAT